MEEGERVTFLSQFLSIPLACTGIACDVMVTSFVFPCRNVSSTENCGGVHGQPEKRLASFNICDSVGSEG